MTKLEAKLIELGYTQDEYNPYVYYKDCIGLTGISLYIKTKIEGKVWTLYKDFKYQSEIDNLQKTFNEMQRDLEVLREYENNL